VGDEYLTKLTTEIPEVQSHWAVKQQLLTSKQAQYYDNERVAAVYYLKPNTASIFLFKEEKQQFVAEALKFADIKNPVNPNLFTTVQIASNDKIYMIGGVQVTSDQRDFLLVPYCRQIDANLVVTDRAPMKAPRCSIPLALLHDKYILAIGGLIGRTKPCSLV
jgi:hypothetical protein